MLQTSWSVTHTLLTGVLLLLSAGAAHTARRQPAPHKEADPGHLLVHSIPPSPFSHPPTTAAAQPPSIPTQLLQGQACAGQRRLRAIFTRSREAAANIAGSSASILAPDHMAKSKSHALRQAQTGKLSACFLQPAATARAPSSAQPSTSPLAQAVQRQIASRMPAKSLAR